MNNRISKSISLGTCAAIVAGTCYALIPTRTATVTAKIQQPPPVITVTDPVDIVITYPAEIAVTDPIDNTTLAKPIATNPVTLAPAEPPAPEFKITDHLIKPGESLSVIFSKLDINKATLHKIIHVDKIGKRFASIAPGKILRFKTSTEGELQQLSYIKNSIESLVAKRSGDHFEVKKLSKEVQREIDSAQVTIHSSLFWDAKNAGLSDKLIMELANLFAWDIDFALSLRDEDQFTLLYEKLLVNDNVIDTGDIIAAEFINQGHSYKTVRFEGKTGKANYYTPDGASMRKTFLRTPIDFARVSSHFNLKRKHPVLNRIRAHKGVDYAAKTGTRIKTTGKGKITFRGRKGGYGNVVIIQHGQKYSTLYAHLSKFRRGLKVGSRVKQGQVIGYVGKTGLATGPHLHYEFRVNGIHRNPLTVKLPNDAPIDKSLLAKFKQQTRPLLSQLEQAKNTLVAKNDF